MTREQLTAMTGNLLSFYIAKNEETLWTELHGSSLKDGKYGLGVVLISKKESCRLCGNVLVAKFTKAVNVIVYHEAHGTFMGCRVPKVCRNKCCKMIQHYGYYTVEDNKFYEEDWEKQQEYFLSKGKTAEVEVLIGKLSSRKKRTSTVRYMDVNVIITTTVKNVGEKREKREGNLTPISYSSVPLNWFVIGSRMSF